MNKANTPIAHCDFLSLQPSVSAMSHDMLNTLGEVTIPRADKNVITLLLQPQGTGDEEVNEPISCRNKPPAEKVSRNSIATLTPGV